MSNIKSFIEFISENKKKKEKGVIPDPIHFKDHNKKEEKIPDVPSPIHYKHHDDNKKNLQELFGWFKKKKVEPELKPQNNWMEKTKDANKHLGKTPEEVSKSLIKQRATNFNKNETGAIRNYTDSSAVLNDLLLHGKKLNKTLQDVHSGIQSAIQKNPIKAPLHLYSGVGFNPQEAMKNGRLHSPSFMSFTHHPDVAYRFAQIHRHEDNNGVGKGVKHIIHLHAMPGDPVVHINDNSVHKDEHESIVNSGVTLRHIGSEFHEGDNSFRFPIGVHVHHFVIDR